MIDVLHCRICGTAYTPGESAYCAKCGQPLGTRSNLIRDIKRIEGEPKPYEALRIASGFIVFLGWVIIIGGWGVSIMLGEIYGSTVTNLISDGVPISIVRNQSTLITFGSGLLFTIQGLFMIASGQVFAVLLDIRNDMHITRRYIRRFGLQLLTEEPAQPNESDV